MRRLLGAFAVAALLVGATARAQESAATEAHEEEAHAAIQNWWSWDYGSTAKDPTHKGWPPPFGFALINFAIFLGIMSRLAWKPLQSYMVQRHDSIAKNLDDAAKLRAAAQSVLDATSGKLAGLDGEIDALLKQIRKEAEAEKARIMAAAEADAQRLRVEAERQIAAEIERARRELRRGVIEAAVAAAAETLRKNVAADDQKKMAERYVADVEHRAKTGRPS
jgi:F-type H+-transporting ATPase subunit b